MRCEYGCTYPEHLWHSLLIHHFAVRRNARDESSVALTTGKSYRIFFVVVERHIHSGTCLVTQVGVKKIY